VRAEGTTEQVSDIVIVCTGGTPVAVGTQLPQVNITVSFATAITSRITGTSSGLPMTEATLLVGEPGSVANPNTPQFACQSLFCPSPSVPADGNAYDGLSWIGGNGVGQPGVTYNDYNMFSGAHTQNNQLTFFGVPIDPAGGSNQLVLRITNVRVNANALVSGPSGFAVVQASIASTNPSALPLNNPGLTVAFDLPSLKSSIVTSTGVAGATTVPVCGAANTVTSTVNLRESFGTAFKTRFANGPSSTPVTNLPIAGADFDVPGFVSQSESGFVNQEQLGVSGLADYGTRLQLTFSQIPAGFTVSLPTQVTLVAASGTSSPLGELQMIQDASGPYAPVDGQTAALMPVAGTATAVYEVVSTTPGKSEAASIPVTVAVSPTASTGTMTVEVGYAPTAPSPVVAGTGPIPQFVSPGVFSNLAQFTTCPSSTNLAITDGAGNPWNSAGEAYGTPVSVGATVPTIGQLPAPTGTVTYNTYAADNCSGQPVLSPVVDISGGTVPALPGTPAVVGVGTYSVQASYSGDGSYAPSTSTCQTFTVIPEPVTVTASSASIPYGTAVPSVTASYSGLVGGQLPTKQPSCITTATATSPPGDYPTSCAGAADQNYTFTYVAGKISVLPIYTVGGDFVIGDRSAGNPTPGTAVQFWGAQWWKGNQLSGRTAPPSFKGFEDAPPVTTCGTNWSTDPGNSTPPPSTVPLYTVMVVSGSITQSGSVISGDTLHLVIVKTDPGYGNDPGHGGTGTIYSVIC
jgi:hypothetical protein